MSTRLALLLCLMTMIGAATAQTITLGTVTRVYDGDSVVISLSPSRTIDVRLAEIDAPEEHQPFAEEAQAALRWLLTDQEVAIELYDVDRHGRAVARIWRRDDGLYVNAWMVRNGYAWVYSRYAEDPELDELQAQAIDAGAGLWQLPEKDRRPPWQWRRATEQ